MNGTARLRLVRTTTLIALSAAALAGLTSLAAASYSGKSANGTISTCMSTTGALRVVDHYPCRRGETALTWNSRGPAGAAGAVGQNGQDGAKGTAGHDGTAGTAGLAGASGHDGQPGAPGMAGLVGAVGPAGADGSAGPAGPAGHDGAPGQDGQPGPAGPQGPAGPAGPVGTSTSSGTATFGRVVNNTDPDCAMTASTGTTTAGSCSMSPLRTLGSLLPAASTVSHFTALFDRAQTGGHIYAITIDQNGRATDVLLLCTVPAGSSTCTQDEPIHLTGNRLFGLEFDGDRTWTGVNFGYQLATS